MYSNKGFAFVQVDPITKVNATEKNVDIALVITKGPPVYFNRILVAGNTKTRDKVVRRELLTNEQELFSGNKVTQSQKCTAANRLLRGRPSHDQENQPA